MPCEMYPSWPRREFLALSFFSTVLAMLGECIRRCLGCRARVYCSCPAGCSPVNPSSEFFPISFFGIVLEMAVAMLGERTLCCLGSRVREYRSCSEGCTPVGLGGRFSP